MVWSVKGLVSIRRKTRRRCAWHAVGVHELREECSMLAESRIQKTRTLEDGKKGIAYSPSLFVRFSYRVDVADMKGLPIVKLGRAS